MILNAQKMLTDSKFISLSSVMSDCYSELLLQDLSLKFGQR